MRCLVLLLVAACAEPKNPFAGNGPHMDNDTMYFGTGNLQMVFGTDRVALPKHLMFQNQDLLRAPATSCDVGYLGAHFDPAVVVDADATVASFQPLQIEMNGPALARVRSNYEATYKCGVDSTFKGSSVFTFFNDGRMFRRDEMLAPASQVLPGSSACPCAMGASVLYRVSTFWAFASGTVVDASGIERTVSTAPACIRVNGATIAIRYLSGSWTVTGQGAPVLADQGLAMASMAGDGWSNTVPIDPSSSEIAIVPGVDDAACTAALAKFTDPMVFVNNTQVMAENGVFKATAAPYSGRIAVTVADTTPSDIVLEIDLGGATHAKVSYPDRVLDSGNYNPQLDGKYALFDLPMLDRGQVIYIEPL